MKAIITILLSVFLVVALNGQTTAPSPPNEGDDNAINSDGIGGGAPVGSGLTVLLLLGMSYATYKKVRD